MPLEKKDLPIYYRDDTEGAPSTAPVLVGFYTLGGLVSEFDILDSAEINERGLMLRARYGRLICHKLNVRDN